MSLILILLILEGFHYETLQNEQKVQQETVLQNCLKDASEERLRRAYARRNPPLVDKNNALLPPCNCVEKQDIQR